MARKVSGPVTITKLSISLPDTPASSHFLSGKAIPTSSMSQRDGSGGKRAYFYERTNLSSEICKEHNLFFSTKIFRSFQQYEGTSGASLLWPADEDCYLFFKILYIFDSAHLAEETKMKTGISPVRIQRHRLTVAFSWIHCMPTNVLAFAPSSYHALHLFSCFMLRNPCVPARPTSHPIHTGSVIARQLLTTRRGCLYHLPQYPPTRLFTPISLV